MLTFESITRGSNACTLTIPPLIFGVSYLLSHRALGVLNNKPPKSVQDILFPVLSGSWQLYKSGLPVQAAMEDDEHIAKLDDKKAFAADTCSYFLLQKYLCPTCALDKIIVSR